MTQPRGNYAQGLGEAKALRRILARLFSAILAAVYLADAHLADGGGYVLACLMFLVIPMTLIWYPESVGAYTGLSPQGYVSNESPGCLLAFVGWTILLTPVAGMLAYQMW